MLIYGNIKILNYNLKIYKFQTIHFQQYDVRMIICILEILTDLFIKFLIN